MLTDTIAGYLKDATAPVTLKKLQKDWCSRHRWSPSQFADLLAEAVQQGAVYAWPRYRNSARYWYRDPATVVRDQVLAVAGEVARSKQELVAQVVRRSYNCGRKPVEQSIGELLKSGGLRSAKPIGSTALYYPAGSPAALVAGCVAVLTERLRKLGIDEPVNLSVAPTSAEPVPEDLLGTIRRLQSSPGVPVTVQSLRAALPWLTKQGLDHAVLSLADQQKLYLTTHDHGWALSETEREQLVWDEGQKLYVAVTLRD